MIRTLFFPEQLNGYYLFPKRILGLDIGRAYIHATLIRKHAHQTSVEQVLEEKVEQGPLTNFPEKAAKALKALLERVEPYDEIRVSLPSTMIVFREMTFPFTSYEKIQKVLPFELEKLLPFPLHSAAVDFTITKSYPAEKKSDILVAAVQQEQLEIYTAIFKEVGIEPLIATVDLLAIYGLYMTMPTYASRQKGVAVIDFGMYSTKIAYINNGTLQGIRTLNQGIISIAKKTSELVGSSPTETLDKIIRFGLTQTDDTKIQQALEQALTSFLDDIRFALYAFTLHNEPQHAMSSILLVGRGADIQNITDYATKNLSVPCELFSLSSLTQENQLATKNRLTIPSAALLSFATALPTTPTDECNLLEGLNHVTADNLFTSQLVTGMGLSALIFILMIGISYGRLYSLKHELSSSKKQAFVALREAFEQTEMSERDLPGAIESAQEEVTKKEQTWFAFTQQEQAPFLGYLLELTSKISNVPTIGFSIDQLTITDGKMVLKAQVKDYNALKLLESELEKSEFFSIVKQDEPIFTMPITVLKSNKE
jgi:type IV pilus assembly protein PilM